MHATAPTFTAPEGLTNTTLTFQLAVSDGTNTSYDTVAISVHRDNDAPTAEAGPAQTVDENDVVTLAGSGVDPEGQTLTYTWTQTGGPTVALSNANATAPTFTAPEGLTNTTLTFQLAVSDGTNTSYDTVTIDVNRDNDAPTAEAGPAQTVAETEVVTLAGSGVDPEGQALTYTWTQTAGPTVTLSDANATAPTFTAPEGLANTTLTFQLAVSDGTNTSYDTVTIDVNRDNDAPTAEAGPAQSVDENDLVTLAGSGVDPEGQALTYTWTQTGGPTVTLSDTHATAPTFTAPEGLTNTTLTFQLAVSDGTNTSYDTVTISVDRDNDAPTANAGPDQAVSENDVVTLVGAGVDPEGQALTYTWTQTAGPSVTLNDINAASPTFTAPEGLTNTSVTFQLAVSDGTNTSVDTVTIDINRDNDAPTANAGPDQNVNENDVVTLVGAGVDPEGQALTYTWTQTAGPSVTLSDINAASPTFTAPEGLTNTSVTFQLAVSDGTNTSVDTVTIDINRDNDAPTANAGPDQSVNENDVVTLVGAGVDPEGQALTYTWTQTAGPSVTLNDINAASPTFTAPEGLTNTSVTFQLAVSDGTNTSVDTVTIDINRDNDAPTANAGPDQAVNENDVVTLVGAGVDPEGQALTYTWTQTAGPSVTLSDVNAASPTFTAPEGLTNTSVTFQLAVSDGTNTSVDTVTIDINRDNDAPTANAGPDQSVNENDVVTLVGAGVDPEGQALTYTWTQTAGPSVTLSDVNAASPTFTAPEGLTNTSVTFQLAVSDGTNTSVDTVTIDINRDNDAPTANAGPDQAVSENDVVTLVGAGVDPEGQALTYTWTQTAGPSVTLNDVNAASPTFTAPEGLTNTSVTFQLAVSDGTNTSVDTVTIDINRDNDAPTANAGPDQAVNENDVVTLVGAGVDPEGQALTYTWTQTAGPSVTLSDINAASPTFTAPEGLTNTSVTFQLAVSDGTNTSVDTVTIDINRDNDAPTANAGPDQNVNENDVVTLVGAGVDPEGQALTYTWTQTAGPSVTLSDINAASPTFTAPEGLTNTSVTFQLAVSDGTNTSVDTVTIDINRDNDAPTANAGPDQNVNENDVVTLVGAGVDPEGQALTYTWTQTAGPSVTLSDINAASPTFTAPEGLTNTSVTFQLAVSDGTNTSVDTVTIDINRDNDAPTANAGPDQNVNENDVVTLVGAGVDPEGQALTYTWTQTAGPSVTLSDINAASPTFTAPEGLTNTSVTFQLAVSDGTNTSVDTVTIDINRDNDAPTANAGPDQNVNENDVVTLVGAGVDPEGQALTYTWTQTAGPSVTLSDINAASPTFTAPEGLTNTSVTFQLAVSDGTNTSVDTVTIDINRDNDAPTANAGPDQNVNENDVVTLVGAGVDPEGQALTYTWTQTAGPSVTLSDINAASPTFTAPEGLTNTSVTFQLAVSDGTNTSVDTVTIDINRDNDAPTANAGPDQAVNENDVVTLVGAGVDPEGQALTYTWTQTAGPSVTLNDVNAASPTFTAPEGLTNTSVTFQLAVSDGTNTSVDTVTIDINRDNDAPTANAGPDQAVNENDVVTLVGAGVDPEGQALTYTWTQTAGPSVTLSDVNAASPTFTAPEGLTNTSVTFQLAVSDGTNTSVDTVTIGINRDNDAPTANAGPDQNVNENDVVTLVGAGVDPEGQALTYTWTQTAGPSVTLSDVNAASPTFTAPEGLTNTSVTFQLAVSDGTNTSVDTVTIDINRDNDAPTANAGPDQAVNENDVVTLVGAGVDPEGQALTYTWTQTAGPSVTLSDINAASPTFTAPEGLTNTSVTFQLAVSDGTNTSVDTVTIDINRDNDAPTANAGPDQNVNENDVVTLVGAGVDPEGQALTYTWTQTAGPSVTLSDVNAASPTFTAPEGLTNTSVTFQLAVSDGTNTSVDTVTIDINRDNDAPTANAGPDQNVNENDVVTLVGAGVDPEGQALTYTWTQTAGPSVTLSDVNAASPTFTAPEGLTNTSVTFQLAVSDGTNTSVDTVTIDINRDNDAPTANAGPDQAVNENDVVTLVGAGVDPEGQALTYTWTQTAGPSVTLSDINAASPTFTAPEGLTNTSVTFQLAVSDGTNTSVDTVTIDINRDNDAPTANAGPDQIVNENDVVTLIGAGVDPEGQALTYTWTQTAGPSVTLSDVNAASPTFTAPEGLTNTSVTFQLAVSDGTNTSVDTVTIDINRDNDAPTANAGPDQSVNENDVVTLVGAGVDPEGQALTYTWTQTAGPSVTLSDVNAASPTFTAPEGLTNTSVTFQLAVSDGTNTSVDTVTIDINRDNDAPTANAGPDQAVNENDVVTLVGAGVDPEGQALTYTWTQTAGPSVTLNDVNAASPTFTAPEGLTNTSVTFQLAVSDGTNTSVDTVTIDINRDNDAPTANAGPDQAVNENDVVTLVGAGVDPEGQALTYTWTQTAGPSVTLSDINAASPTFTAPEGLTNTSVTFQLAVSDGTNTSVDTVTIDINRDNDAPTANAGPDQAVNENDVVTLVGAGVDPEGQALTYTWTQTAGPSVTLSDINAASPTFTAPEGLTNTSVTFQLAVSDGTNTSVDTVTIDINRDNDAPTANAGPDQAVNENDVVTLVGAGVDPEGQALTYTWTQTAGPSVTLSDVNAASPTFTAPEGLTNTSVTFQLAVSDGTNTSVDTVTIDINRDNDAPTANAGPDQAVNENDVVTLVGAGVDPEGQALTYTWTQTAGPSVALNDVNAASPTFTAPEGLTNTSVTFQLAVSDGTNTSVDTVTIDINRDNDAPTANAGPDQNVNENDVVTLVGAGVDPEGQALTYTWTQTAGPSVTLSDVNAASPTFTAPEGLTNTSVTFQLAVSDGTNTSVDTVTIDINRDNDAPTANAGPDQNVNENDVVTLVGAGVDPEGQALTYTWTQTAGPSVTLSDVNAASPTFTAPEGLTNTSVTFRLAVSDGTNTSVDTVTIDITRDNDAPTANAGPDQAVSENDVVTLVGAGVDPEGQALTYTWTQTAGPSVTLSDINAASPTFTAPEGLTNTSVTFQLAVSDGTNTSVDTVTIDINRDNDAPTANAGPDQNVNENDVVTLVGAGVDPEGQALTYTWTQTAGPSVTLSDINAASPTFTAPEGLTNTSVTFQLAVSDGTNTSVDTVTIDINRDNDAPTANAGPDQAVNENDVVTLVGAGVDPEGQALTYTWTQTAGPSVTLSDVNAASPTFTAPEGLTNTSVTFQLAVSDGTNTSVDTVTIDINRDNDAPTANAGPDQAVNENDVVTLVGAGVDPEGQALTYTWTQTAGPSVTLSDVNAASPTFTAPEGLTNTSVTFQLAVSDGTNTSVDTVTIDINRDNDAPTANAGPDQAVNENDVVTLVGAGVDPEGQALTYTWTQTAGPSVTLNDVNAASPTFTAPEGLTNTSVTFQLAVSDGTNTSVDTVTIDINRDNDAPTANAGPDQNVNENDVVTLVGAGVDPEGQALTYTWTQTAGPSVTLSDINAASPTFTAPEGLTNTSVTFQLAVSDGTNTSVDTVTIDINRDNDAPTANAGPDQAVNENDVVTLVGAGVDPEGQALTYTWTQTAGPSVTLNDVNAASPTFTAPEGLTNTSVTFQLAVSDGTNTSVDTVTIDINRDNDAPTANAGPDQNVNENDVVTLVGAGVDPEGQALTYTWTQTAGPSVTLNDVNAASPTFTAPEGLTNTSVTFQLAVSDGTNTSVDTVTIDINRDNDAPTANAGPDQAVNENDVVTLVGAGVDPEGQALTYTWTQTAGPSVTLSDVNAASPTFTAPEGLTNTSVTFQLAVSDGTNTSVDTVTIDINRDNDAPTANAGPDQAVNENDVVTLVGAGVDPEGQALTYTWTQTAGPSVTLSDVNAASPTFTAPEGLTNTSVTFQLAVSDGTNTSVDTVTIDINRDNDAPTANAGPDQAVNENDVVTLVGAGVDPEGQALTYTWTQTAGPSVTLSDVNAASPTFTAPEGLTNTSVTFQLAVSDGTNTSVDTVTIDINRDNDAPTANAGPDQAVNENDVVTLVGAGVDPEGQALTYTWTQTAGPSVTLSDINAASPTFTAPEGLTNTSVTFQLAVSDGTNTSVDAVTIDINRDNDAPTANAGPDQAVNENDVVTLVGAGVDPEGQALTYTWTQTAGPSVTLSDVNAASPTFTAPEGLTNTSVTFQLGVSDGTNTSVDTVTIDINRDNDAPTANAGPDQNVNENDVVTLVGAGVDPEGQALTYTWTQTAGPSVTLSDVNAASPTFTAPEGLTNTSVTFQLAVSDGTNTSVDTVTIDINRDNDAPTANAGPDQNVNENDVVTLVGAGVDPEGQALTYTWTQTAGPSVTLSDVNAASPTFTAPEGLTNTSVTFQLAVSDGTNTSVDTVTIDINRDNDAPTANAGPDQAVNENDVVTLVGAGVDPEGQALTYTWTQTAGPSVTLNDVNAASPTFTAPEGLTNTSVTFQLAVSDGTNTSVDTVTIDINRDNDAPTANAGPDQSVNENDVVTLVGAGVDPEGQALTYTWTQTAGPSVTLSDVNAASPTFTAPEGLTNTSVTFQLAVSDGTNTSVDTVTIDINRDNDAPTAEAGPTQTVSESAVVTLAGSGVDPERQALTYTWTQTAGPSVTLSDVNAASPSFSAPTVAGNTTLTFQLAVSDGTSTSYDTVTIAVQGSDQPPVVDAGPAQQVPENSVVLLEGVAFDPSGDPLSYTWVQVSGPQVQLSDVHSATPSFTAPELVANTTLVFQLNVSDGSHTTSDTVQVLVNAVDNAPTADAGPDQSIQAGTLATVRGSASDPEGLPLSYTWQQVTGPAVTITDRQAADLQFVAPEVAQATELTFELAVSDGREHFGRHGARDGAARELERQAGRGRSGRGTSRPGT